MKLEALKIMADNGRPMDLRLEIRDGQSFISRDGGPEAAYERWSPLETLQRQLANYPREVWINGEKLETAPRPTLAEVSILEPTGRNMSSDMDHKIDLGEPEKSRAFNANIGGVWTTVNQKPQARNKAARTYFSPIPGEAQHHRLLAMVTMVTHMEIESDEIGMLKDTGNGMGMEIEPDPELERRIEERLEAMLHRTMCHPAMPKPYEGRAYACPLVGQYGSEQYTVEAPVAVLGTPVVIEQYNREMTNGEFISIVEALYESDSKMVPVNEMKRWVHSTLIPGAAEDVAVITAAAPVYKPEGAEQPTGITVAMKLEDEGLELQVPARFWITGSPGDDLEVKVAPGSITQEELGDILMRVSWSESEYSSSEQKEYEREQMEEKLHNLAGHHLGSSRAAVLQELQWAADRFDSWTPLPNEAMSATSRDGRITVTLNPRAEK